MIEQRDASTYLECRYHLAFFLTIDKIVMVLHDNKWRQMVGNSIIYFDVDLRIMDEVGRKRLLCIAWTRI